MVHRGEFLEDKHLGGPVRPARLEMASLAGPRELRLTPKGLARTPQSAGHRGGSSRSHRPRAGALDCFTTRRKARNASPLNMHNMPPKAKKDSSERALLVYEDGVMPGVTARGVFIIAKPTGC